MNFEALANEHKDAVYRQMIRACGSRKMPSLSRQYRDVNELRDVEELPGSEVAQRLGISLAAVKSRLHRARELLWQRLDTAR